MPRSRTDAIPVHDRGGIAVRGGTRQVYRVEDPPEGGWDPDLHVWLERAGVRIE